MNTSNNTLRCIRIAMSVILILGAATACAEVPQLINYQGRLLNDTGAPIDTVVDVTFFIYDDTSGGAILWSELCTDMVITDGLFSALLGAISPLPPDILAFDGNVRGLSVQVGAEPPGSAMPIVSVAYAYQAGRADTAEMALSVAGGGGGWTDDGTTVRLTTMTDNVGIGTNSPAAKLSVGGDVFFEGKATIGTGHSNTGSNSVILGGTGNTASADLAVVSGGDANTASGSGATLSGGQGNTADGLGAVVGGGAANWALADFATIAGGGPSDLDHLLDWNNRVFDNYGTIGGGGYNRVGSDDGDPTNTTFATVAGGAVNWATGLGSAIGGGLSNLASGRRGCIAGGESNEAYPFAFVGGGLNNRAVADFAVICGGWSNTAEGYMSFTGNGDQCEASGYHSVIVGGFANDAVDSFAVIGGGERNTASGEYATIAGGCNNQVSAFCGTIAGGGYNDSGGGNRVYDDFGSIGGGRENIAGTDDGINTNAYFATVAGGFNNDASGGYSMIPGGTSNIASGAFSFAAGKMAAATHDGSFVWADNTTMYCQSDTTNQFKIRATNGLVLDASTESSAAFIENTGTGRSLALYADNNDEPHLFGGALYAVNYGTSPTICAFTAANGPAAYLHGDVTVVGTITETSSVTKIDHPLDPENKYLYHSGVQSSEMMNIYNGNAVLDSRGEAWIELPDWFELMNKDFRYQLTCIGGHADVYIAREVEHNSFQVAGGFAGLKVSWQVTGIRHDAYAEANRVPVEEDKKPNERGAYLHPEAYGLGEEFGMHYEEMQEQMGRLNVTRSGR